MNIWVHRNLQSHIQTNTQRYFIYISALHLFQLRYTLCWRQLWTSEPLPDRPWTLPEWRHLSGGLSEWPAWHLVPVPAWLWGVALRDCGGECLWSGALLQRRHLPAEDASGVQLHLCQWLYGLVFWANSPHSHLAIKPIFNLLPNMFVSPDRRSLPDTESVRQLTLSQWRHLFRFGRQQQIQL